MKNVNEYLKFAITSMLFLSGIAFSSVPSGQIMIINSLSNGTSVGSTATSVTVQVSDSIGICSPARMLVYGGSTVIKWDSAKTHSPVQCTGITAVNILTLRTIIGSTSTIIYDRTTSTPVPSAYATGPVVYTPPTNSEANLVLLVTGDGNPASTQSATATTWGIGAAALPVFNAGNGDLVTIGVPGGMGLSGLKAAELAKAYGVKPHP